MENANLTTNLRIIFVKRPRTFTRFHFVFYPSIVNLKKKKKHLKTRSPSARRPTPLHFFGTPRQRGEPSSSDRVPSQAIIITVVIYDLGGERANKKTKNAIFGSIPTGWSTPPYRPSEYIFYRVRPTNNNNNNNRRHQTFNVSAR